jgi:hypothetical protein
MNRSLWPEGVEVHQIDLVRNTQDAIDAIAARYTSTNQMGIAAGLEIRPDDAPNNDKLRVANGSGYTSSGELVIVSTVQTAIALADPTVGAINYILAVYTEVYGDPQAHEDLGTTLPTSAIGSYRIVVLTAAQWQSLSITDPNLNNNSRDRSVLLAIVTGSGGVLSQNNIQSPLDYPPVYYVTQPTTISGVYVNSVSTTSQSGTGTLTYLSGPKTLQWAAPGDSIGLPSGSITTNGTFTIYSSNASYAITVTVTVLDLPSAPATIINNITVSSIYSQDIPRLTGVDNSHRHMLGSGIPSMRNPHALTLADIGGDLSGALQQHQVEMHANGIYDPDNLGPTQTQLVSSIVIGSGINDVVYVSSFDIHGVAYINGLRVTSLTGSNIIAFDDVDDTHIGLYGVYLEPNGTISKTLRLSVNPIQPDVFGGNVQPVDISDYDNTFNTSNNYSINYDGSGNFSLTGTNGAYPTFWVPYTNRDARGILRLPYPRFVGDSPPVIGAYNYIDIWIGTVATSWGLANSLSLTVYDRLPQETSFQLSYVVSQGMPSGVGTVMLGWGQYGQPTVQRELNVIDRRLFGTLAGADINQATIGKEKIKDLSQEQVFNAIGYTPYPYSNPSGFALRTGAAGAEPTVTSHVMYADVAGSGGTPTSWASLSGKPTSLASMADIGSVNANKFTETMWFNNGIELPFTQSIRWGNTQYIQGANDGSFNMVGGNVNVGVGKYISWGGFNKVGYEGGNFTVYQGSYLHGSVTIDGILYMNSTLIRQVANPINPQDAATKYYVDNRSSSTIFVGGRLYGSGNWTSYPPGVVDNIIWSGPPSENEWTFTWYPAQYQFVSLVCMGALSDPGSGAMFTIKKMDEAAGAVRVGTFANSGAWDYYPFFYMACFIKL